ncbi:MAG: right-handed parallel beta-helix repeat-containing protein [Planctomycetota bacterium]|jgi:parallel beta-helix repeat protein
MLKRKMIVGMILAVLVFSMGVARGVDVSIAGNGNYLQDDAALLGLETEHGQPAYKPGEVIVKFREFVADSLEAQLADGRAVETLILPQSLENINSKYKVKKIQPIIKNFKSNRKRLKDLVKKDKAALSKKEKHLVRRLKRAPKGAKVPDLGRIYKIELGPGQSAPLAVAEYSRDPDVEYAELNYILSYMRTPNDPNYFPEQWALHNDGQSYPVPGGGTESGTEGCDVNAPEAWDISTGSSEVWVAVLDSGVDYRHGDLIHNIWVNTDEVPDGNDDDDNDYIDDIYGYDFANDDNDPMDDLGHGTHCAGIIAAEGNNELDIVGASWNAKIMALKIGDAGISTDDAIEGIEYAADNGSDVLSCSWGPRYRNPSNPPLEDAVHYAHLTGCVIVFSAGNKDDDVVYYSPANHSETIAVAATDSNDQKASFSNYGDLVNVAAPGVDILSLRGAGTDLYGDGEHLYPYGDTNATMYICSGTSMACPYVAGGCAQVLSIDPTLGPNDVNEILMMTADELADANLCASGRLNIHKAVIEAIASKGHIDLDKDYYNCDCNVGIFLADWDLNGANTVDVNITTSGGDLETVTLSEGTPAVGIFTGTISTASGDPNIGDGILQVSDGNTITATYEDANDGSGNPASPNDTATADCVYPVIYNLDFDENPLRPDITISFDTDEFSYTRVLYGESCGGSYKSSTLSLGFNHTVELKEVSPWTDYYFIVEATDLAGNETVDTNDSNCYRFTTDGPRDINVPADYNTIQEAIDQPIWDGSRVIVAEGTYNESIDFKGKGITVCSVDPNDWDVVTNTIIYAPYAIGVVRFTSGEDSDSMLAGLTIKGAGSTYVCIWITSSSNPTITNCRLTDNGYAIYCKDSSPTIKNNKIFGHYECGIYCYGASAPVIESNWIYDTYAIGIYFQDVSSTGIVQNNTIVGNWVGIWVDGEVVPEISNCIFWDNDSNDLEGCSATYSRIDDCNDVNDTTHNICDEPLFVDDANDNYHIEPNSPCINAGDPNGDYTGRKDIDGDPRVICSRVDMGADETLFSVHNITQNRWYTTINGAIDDANNGDEIVAYPGTYYETVDFDGKAITVRSTNPSDVNTVEATIIDANGGTYGVHFHTSEDANSVLTGLTVKNADRGIYCNYASPTISNCIVEDHDYGIYAYNSANPTINNCIIKNNTWDGIVCYLASPTIENCIIENTMDVGLYVYGSPTIRYNIIRDNYRGMYLYNSSSNIKSNWIYDNGLFGVNICDSSSAVLRNNTICGTTTTGIYKSSGTQPNISNCILWDNGDDLYDCTATYSCIEDGDAGTGNISSNPCFVDADSNDFHLDSNSPCIDVGDPNGNYDGEKDIDGEWRVMRGRIDMGADEFPRVHNITQGKWYVQIADAIAEANDADEIEVYKGIFYESVYVNKNFLILRSTDPNDCTVVADTIIDANNGNYGILCASYLDPTLAGLTIRNANQQGINCSTGSSPTIKNCIVEENGLTGILSYQSSATIINNKIRENGAGINLLGGGAQQIKNNWIYENNNGLIFSGVSENKVIRNNTIVGNTAAGIYKYLPIGTQPTISNCILWDNNDDLSDCTATYSCIEDGDAGTGNISSDPCFVDADSNDFHLKSDSPCIDVGDPNNDDYDGEKDIDGQPRLADGDGNDTFVVDMGADEYMLIYNADSGKGYINIQDAIDDANDGDTITVTEGTYYESIDFDGKSITVRSSDPDDDDVVTATIIDANATGRVVTFNSSEDANSVLTGLTITGGYVSGIEDGAGIYCYGSSPTISRCVIYDNNAVDDGGGIACDNSSSPSISACLITSNEAGDGGGICCNNNSNPTISYCDITYNEVDDKAGGIYCKANSCPIIKGCDISLNSADMGGGIYCNASDPNIEDCNVNDNYAGDDAGGIYCYNGSDPTISNCEITDNEAEDKGGGMYCKTNSDPTIEDCEISLNDAYKGGGIYCNSSEPQIERCIVSGNQTSGDGYADGGGIYCSSSSPNILNCIINDNVSDDDAGGIYCYDDSDPNIINCTLTQNEADDKGGGIYCKTNSDAVITNCILWDDTAPNGSEIYVSSSSSAVVSYSDVEGDWSGAYNINSDPLFLDPNNNDFHLLDANSPCIDVGDPNGYYTGQTDIDGDNRVIDIAGKGDGIVDVDMGGDEYKEEE